MIKFLAPILLFLAAVGLFFGFIDPRYQALQAQKVLLARNQAVLANSRQISDLREKLRERYNSVDPKDIENLKKMLPDGVDNVRLILDLNSLASRHGMSIRNVKVGGDSDAGTTKVAAVSQASGTVGSIQLSFSVTAPYSDFVAYLQDIENSLRIVDITSLSVKAAKQDSYDYDITLKTYWLR